MTKTYTAAQTAKIIRQELKDKFPQTKFSVRTEPYSMGASIRIAWEDGYTVSQVEEVVKRFACRGESRIDDYVPFVTDIWEGEEVRWGSDYVNCYRTFSNLFQTELDDFYLDYLDPLLKKEMPEYRENVQRYQSQFSRQYRDTVNYHDAQRYEREVRLRVYSEYIEAYPCPRIAEELEISKNLAVSVVKTTSLVFDPKYPPAAFLVDGWEYRKQSYDEWAFSKEKSQVKELSEPLMIDGITLEGKIADYVRVNSLEAKSLEFIAEQFYSVPKSEEFLTTEFGDRYQVVEDKESQKIQFIFDSNPTDYVVGMLVNRGFEGQGHIYQRCLDDMGKFAAESVQEALSMNN